MPYRMVFKPRAVKALRGIPARDEDRIRQKIDGLANDLSGDVKRLKSFLPAYRLRVGDYRVLFDVEQDRIIIAMIGHRRDIYDR